MIKLSYTPPESQAKLPPNRGGPQRRVPAQNEGQRHEVTSCLWVDEGDGVTEI